jgi:hypothetical protein
MLFPFYCLFRQMTMETVEPQQDGSVTDSVAESDSAHMQTQAGQNSIPTLAQVGHRQAQRQIKMYANENHGQTLVSCSGSQIPHVP